MRAFRDRPHGALLRVFVGIVVLLPITWAAWASLQPIERIFAGPARHTASPSAGPQWQNYRIAARRLPLARFLLNSFVITTAATVGAVLSASLVGFAFARLRWRGRDAWFGVLLATMMLPSQMLVIPQFLVFQHLGWVNTYKPLIVPSWLGGSAFFIFLFRQFFRSVPQSYEDAARIDGATNWQLYRHVMLPLAGPVIAVVAAMSAAYHWNAFLPPLIYLSDFERYPVSVGLRMYQAIEGSWANLIMAASLIAMTPPALVVLATMRYWMRSEPGPRSSIPASRPRV